MTIQYARGMSQPAYDVYCDDPYCGNYSREFVDTAKDARRYLRQVGWFSFKDADYCPRHP